MTSLEPLAFVLGAVIAAAGYGAGRRQPSGMAAMGTAVAALQSRVETLDDSISDAMRQAAEGRERVAERCAALERQVPSEAEHASVQFVQVRERFERLEAKLSVDCGLLLAEQKRLDQRLEMLEGQVSGVSGAFEEQRQAFGELREAFGTLREASVAQQSVWGELDQQLSDMQDFIMRTAEEAAQQRAALQMPQPPVAAPVAADMEGMLREIATQRQEFQQRQQRRQQEAL